MSFPLHRYVLESVRSTRPVMEIYVTAAGKDRTAVIAAILLAVSVRIYARLCLLILSYLRS